MKVWFLRNLSQGHSHACQGNCSFSRFIFIRFRLEFEKEQRVLLKAFWPHQLIVSYPSSSPTFKKKITFVFNDHTLWLDPLNTGDEGGMGICSHHIEESCRFPVNDWMKLFPLPADRLYLFHRWNSVETHFTELQLVSSRHNVLAWLWNWFFSESCPLFYKVILSHFPSPALQHFWSRREVQTIALHWVSLFVGIKPKTFELRITGSDWLPVLVVSTELIPRQGAWTPCLFRSWVVTNAVTNFSTLQRKMKISG